MSDPKIIPVKNTRSYALMIRDRVLKELDDKYELIYVDYNDQLPQHILEAYVKNKDEAYVMFSEDNDIDNWLYEASDNSIEYILSEIITPYEREQLIEYDLFSEIYDEIRGRDISDPFNDLLKNSNKLWITYDLDYELNDIASVKELKEIAKKLNISYEANKDKLKELSDNAFYGGSLQLLMYINPKDLDDLVEDKEYIVKNINVALIDYINGSGYDVELDEIKIKYNRSNAKADSFYADDVSGLHPEAYSRFTIKEV